MGNLIDMTGWVMSEHGVPDSRLKVLGRAENRVQSNGNIKVMWLCECSCKEHNHTIVGGSDLRSGKVKSCGCLQKELTSQRSLKNISGKRFNRLVAVERVFDKETDKTRWKCVCDCGNECIANYEDLVKGCTQSCGCLKRDNGKSKRKCNKYEINEDTNDVKFYIDDNIFFIVDMCDFDLVKEHNWRLDNNGYVWTKEFFTCKTIRLHNILLPNCEEVDHIDRNKLNNKRNNLRAATRQTNAFNRNRTKNNSSGFIGVYWSKKDCSWYSQITIHRKHIHLGYTATKEQAIVQRLKAELKYFGPDFAPQRHLFEQYGIVQTQHNDLEEVI